MIQYTLLKVKNKRQGIRTSEFIDEKEAKLFDSRLIGRPHLWKAVQEL
jgi:hypothetical protein